MAEQSRPRAARTPVTLITGFLGSGKTTLLNAALHAPEMRGALVIINEFGEVGIDHGLVTHSNDSIVVLENGCLCCTVFGDLLGALYKLYHQREAHEISAYDRVLIETSGLADPTSIVQAFLSDPNLAGLYELTATVTTVDAINYRDTLYRHDEAARQIAVADHILMTKLDLVAATDRSEAEIALRQVVGTLNREATVHGAIGPEFDLAKLLRSHGPDPGGTPADAGVWLGGEMAPERAEVSNDFGRVNNASRYAEHLRVASLSFIRDDALPRTALELLVDGIERNLGHNLLRLKAIVTVEHEHRGPAVIQGVQHLLHNMTWLAHWPFADRKSRFVLIAAGTSTDSLREMIELLERVARRTAKARH